MGIAEINERTLKINSNVHLVYEAGQNAGATATYELIEEITVEEAGNVERTTTPDGQSYVSLYKNIMATAYNPDEKACAFMYLYRGDNKICLNTSSVNAGEYGVAKNEMIADGIAQCTFIKRASTNYGSNVISGCVECSGNASRVLIGSCAVGTTVKIYGMRA